MWKQQSNIFLVNIMFPSRYDSITFTIVYLTFSRLYYGGLEKVTTCMACQSRVFSCSLCYSLTIFAGLNVYGTHNNERELLVLFNILHSPKKTPLLIPRMPFTSVTLCISKYWSQGPVPFAQYILCK